jgi:hypothetical protein
MVRIFLVVTPGIVAQNGIHFEQSEQEYQTAAKFSSRYVVEAMIAIAQVVGLLEANVLDQLRCITLVGQYCLPQRQVVRILFVVAGADKVAGVALAQELRRR